MAEKVTPTHPRLMEGRYFALIIVLSFVILSTTTFLLCYWHHRVSTEQTLKEDRAAASILSLLLGEHLKKIVNVMESFSNRPLLIQAVKAKNAEKAQVHLINLKKSNPDVDILIITNRQGTVWVAYPERPELLGQNLAYRDWYKGVSKEWKPNVTDVVLRIVREKDLAVAMSIPIFDEREEVIGILVNTQRLSGLKYLFEPAFFDIGTFITVTDRKGQIAFSSHQETQKEIRPYPFYSGLKKAVTEKNRTFMVDEPGPGGGKHYISFAPVSKESEGGGNLPGGSDSRNSRCD